MNWSKTKTIFIICFLLLDIFLTYQLFLRQKSAQDQVDNIQQNSFSQYIKNKTIQINTPLPVASDSLTFLSGMYQSFGSDADQGVNQALQILAGPKNSPIQTFSVGSNTTILKSTFVKPIPVPNTEADKQVFLKQYVYNGDQYSFWTYDKTQQVYKYVQTYNGHPVFSVVNGNLNTLDLNLDSGGNYVTGYTQSFVKIKKEQSTKLGVQPMDAIQQLWEKNKLPISDKPVVEQVALGFINLSDNSDQSQTLTYLPAWYIEVKTTTGIKQFFVTGIYGRIQTINGGE